MKYLQLSLLLILMACSSSTQQEATEGTEQPAEVPQQKTEGYILAISKVDNSVNVFVEDSLIFASGTIHESPEVDFQIDLTPLIKDGSETVKIELWNGVEPYNPQVDALWEVRYDLIIDGNIVDFIHEFGDDNAIGKVYENSYVISEWLEESN